VPLELLVSKALIWFPLSTDNSRLNQKLFWLISFYIIECEHGTSKTTVARADMRGLVIYLTFVRREATSI